MSSTNLPKITKTLHYQAQLAPKMILFYLQVQAISKKKSCDRMRFIAQSSLHPKTK